jgi:hypothetical protein
LLAPFPAVLQPSPLEVSGNWLSLHISRLRNMMWTVCLHCQLALGESVLLALFDLISTVNRNMTEGNVHRQKVLLETSLCKKWLYIEIRHLLPHDLSPFLTRFTFHETSVFPSPHSFVGRVKHLCI